MKPHTLRTLIARAVECVGPDGSKPITGRELSPAQVALSTMALAHIGRLAIAYADSLETMHNTPGIDGKAYRDAHAELLAALLSPESTAMRWHGPASAARTTMQG